MKKAPVRVLFSNEVCLSAREAACVVKLLRSEVSAEVGSTLHFTLCVSMVLHFFTSSLAAMEFYFPPSSVKRLIRWQNHSAARYLHFTRTMTGFHWPHSSHRSGSLEIMYFLGESFVPMILFQQSKQYSAIDITLLYDITSALQMQCILLEPHDVN